LRSDAKRRMAAVEAGRAVVLSLTPGIPAVQHVTIQPRGGALGRIVFEPMVRSSCATSTIAIGTLEL
jgi:ATP-dependent Zn protease